MLCLLSGADIVGKGITPAHASTETRRSSTHCYSHTTASVSTGERADTTCTMREKRPPTRQGEKPGGTPLAPGTSMRGAELLLLLLGTTKPCGGPPGKVTVHDRLPGLPGTHAGESVTTALAGMREYPRPADGAVQKSS